MVIDILLAIFAVFGFMSGYSKGIIKTLFTVLAYLIGVMAAFKFSPAMTNFLKQLIGTDHPMMFIAGFLLTFLSTMLIIRVLARSLEAFMEKANINFINQIAGGSVMAALSILVLSMLLWFANNARMIDEPTKEISHTYEYLEAYPDFVWSLGRRFQPTFQEFWDTTLDFMDQVKDRSVKNTQTERTYEIRDHR